MVAKSWCLPLTALIEVEMKGHSIINHFVILSYCHTAILHALRLPAYCDVCQFCNDYRIYTGYSLLSAYFFPGFCTWIISAI